MAGVVKSGSINCFLIYRAGDGRINLTGHSQLNDLFHILERCASTFGGNHFMLEGFGIDIPHVEDIDAAQVIEPFTGRGDRLNFPIQSGEFHRIAHHLPFGNNQGPTDIIDFWQ